MFKRYISNDINTSLMTRRGGVLTLLFIVLVNLLIYSYSHVSSIPKIQRRKDAVGLSHDKAQHFVYFYYYKGLFPLATLSNDLTFSRIAAEKEISDSGVNLIMEYEHWARLGENARIWTYMPNALVSGSAKNPSVKLFNFIYFLVALIVLFFGFRSAQQPLLGLIIMLIVNFSPYFLFEIYSNENIFGLMGALFIFILGINALWIFSRCISLYHLIIPPLISGALIAFTTQIRNETVIVLVAALLIYLLWKGRSILLRFIPIALLLLSFYVTKKGISDYFQRVYNETYSIVVDVGGHPYNGNRIGGHRFWHPVFCGLGDFDYKYGYEWDDKVAYEYAIPILKQKYGLEVPYSGKLHLDKFYDSASLYYVKFDEIDYYEDVMRDKVLSDISNDPLWYAYIVFMRVFTLLTITQPLPLLGWVAILLLYYFYRQKDWTSIKLLLFSLPISAGSLLVYAGRGSTFNSMFSVIALALFLYYQKDILIKLKRFRFIQLVFGEIDERN